MRAAVRQLCRKGEAALKPTFDSSKNKWRKPAVSRRVAADIRKFALAEGTFGSFDQNTGKGWDPKWDTIGHVGTMQLRPPKQTARQRSRESRAKKIEGLMEGMDNKIEDYRVKKQESKPERSFENYYKKLSVTKKK